MNEPTGTQSEKQPATRSAAEAERVMRPAVDIFEDAHGITLKADLPGVSRDRLDIQVDGNALMIEGIVAVEVPQGTEALYADVRATRYRRGFTLSRELDTSAISAEMRDGVLTLTVPKRSELKPRKIEIKAG